MSDSKIFVNEVKGSAREEANVSGRWSADENRLFLRGLEMHGKDHKKIAALVKTRNVTQVRNKAQKHFQKLAKEEAGPLPMSLDPFYQARANGLEALKEPSCRVPPPPTLDAYTPVLEKNKRRKIMEEAYKLSPEGRCREEKRKAENADRMRKEREEESEETQQTRKAEDADRKRREREQQSEEDRKKRLKQDRERQKERYRNGLDLDIEPGDVYETIRAKLMIKAKNFLHRTKKEDGEKTKDLEEEDHQFHKAPVCIVCDHFIIGVEKICKLRPDQILKHKHRIGVESYERHYKMKLPAELVKQYEVEGLEGMLLSPRFREYAKGYSTCSHCFSGMQSRMVLSKNPPKFAIANGFVIGCLPSVIVIMGKDGVERRRMVQPKELTDIMRAMLAPTRAYGCVFAYTGSQQSVMGHYQFFEMDQSRIGGVMHHLNATGIGRNIFCVLCGRMTPSQKKVARDQAHLDTQLYLDLLTWFIQSGHPGYEGVPIPEDCPEPIIIEDEENQNNTNEEIGPSAETRFDGATYYFSSAQDPSESNGVYDSKEQFTMALLNKAAPTLLAYGGSYVNGKELKVESILPFQFPYGLGGPKMNRRTPVSHEVCIQSYGRISLPQMQRSDASLIFSHVYNRQKSFMTGVMTCRRVVDGISLGERLSTLTIQDYQGIAEDTSDSSSNSMSEGANQLLKAISTSCRAMGHTTESARFNRRCCFALGDYHGLNSLMLTITPCDECSFRVRLYATAGETKEMPTTGDPSLEEEVTYSDGWHELPSLQYSDSKCIADFDLRKKVRLGFPGACSLEYQSVMQVVTEVLLQWDVKKQQSRTEKGGILGKLLAFVRADEEQGRKTLHSHWQVWVKELNQKLRDQLFDKNEDERAAARKEFCEYIDQVMSASYGPDLIVTHNCKEGTTKTGPVDAIYEECHPNTLREARHNALCHGLQGRVIKCKECKEETATIDTFNISIERWRDFALKDEKRRNKDGKDRFECDAKLPMLRERLDIAAYTYSYHMDGGSLLEKDPFWGSADIRTALLHQRFNYHDPSHRPSCFKKGCECRFPFPLCACMETDILEDEGEYGENVIEWCHLNGTVQQVRPFLVTPKRPMGCQYINIHNKPISELLNCNTNLQIGDPSQVYYSTLYTSKTTQKDDEEPRQRIANQCTRRLLRIQNEVLDGIQEPETEPSFTEGLCRLLSGMNAATSRNVISATMAHLINSNGGSRFIYSTGFADLLIRQLEATLEGEDVNVRIRSTVVEGEVKTCQDSSADDYIYRPNTLKKVCYYEMTMKYKKEFKSKKECKSSVGVWTDEQDGDEEDTHGDRLYFTRDHPGRSFCYLRERKLKVIPKTSLPEGKLCRLEQLELGSECPSQGATEKREDYAKMALLMFYPFRYREDLLKVNGSYWELFDQEREKRFNGQETALTFWPRGFEILQNIQDRMTLDKKMTRARDPILKEGKPPQVDETDRSSKKRKDDDSVIDISEFCMGDESEEEESDGYGLGEVGQEVLRSHSQLIDRSNFGRDHMIGARLSSTASLFQEDEAVATAAPRSANRNRSNLREKSYPTLLKLIAGSLVGDSEYDDIYQDYDKEDTSEVEGNEQNNNFVVKVPTLTDVARKVARTERKVLDEEQYVTYEILACTFLLQLIREASDKNSDIGACIGQALQSDESDMKDLVKKLQARGGQEQLLMFLTGPAGSGKSTAVKVAQRFCFEFCLAMGVMWTDMTFFFTAYTGSAASQFEGMTICKSAFLKKTGDLSERDKREWQDVKLLIIDEISFMKDGELKRLDQRLKEMFDRTKPFGGMSIVFAGDFRQMENGATDKDLLYSRQSSRLWENCINTTIILKNDHRFKDDPEYGQMLKRMWSGDLTREDRERINTRVLGHNGLTLPSWSSFDGSDACFACPRNKERNSIHAGHFCDHITKTHPSIHSTDLPPDHTIIIEADIQNPSTKTSKMKVDRALRHRIITTCGDADVKVGLKLADPALRLYIGAYIICNVDNKHLKDKVPIGNGTLGRVVGMKLKDHAPSYKWKNWDGKKVWTVCASDVEWVQCEKYPKTNTMLQLEKAINELKCGELDRKNLSKLESLEKDLQREIQSRRFKLSPQSLSADVKVKIHDFVPPVTIKCRMTQLPLNLNDATTGHKLQGMSKDVVIVTSWPSGGAIFKNWEYVALSRVRTLSGLFLFEPIDMEKSFEPSTELRDYLTRAQAQMDRILNRRKLKMAACRE